MKPTNNDCGNENKHESQWTSMSEGAKTTTNNKKSNENNTQLHTKKQRKTNTKHTDNLNTNLKNTADIDERRP